MEKIYIDPSSRILYSSYYTEGFYEVFGRKNVSFSDRYFKKLIRKKDDFSFQHFFSFVHVSNKNIITKFVIDFCDPFDIHENAYDWCDFYCKINLNIEFTEQRFLDKIIQIPASFGIRIWNLPQTFFYCLNNYFRFKKSILVSFKDHLKDYFHQLKRARIENYENYESETKSKKPYIFMIGTFWEDENSLAFTNLNRKKFIEVCEKNNCDFEGGFFSRNITIKNLEKYIFEKPYSCKDYISKTKKSLFVYNTPAVHNCHGWKLGEFIAMNKPIISTHLINEIPIGLEHEKNIHFVGNEIELDHAVKLLINNENYCIKLSHNLKEYYLKNMSPKAVIKNIILKI